MTTRILDLRPYIPEFNGPLGWVIKTLGFWSPQAIETASELTRRGLPIDPEVAAREFVVRDEPLPPGRLDLVVAYVGSQDKKYPDAGELRTLGEQVHALRTDGTLGLLCVTTDEHSQSVANLGSGPFDFVIRLGTTATDVIPELVEVLQTAMESIDELQGGYDVGVCRVSLRRDSEPFEVVSDLGARTLEPLFGDQWGDPADHCVVSTPERFATGIRTAIKPASLLEWTKAVDEVRMVGFRRID